ncbi:MAG TPA: hypothetical protein VJH03_21075 [Blastocatellia bacterium]|nr:hypothetical protein [Blastocatellia bacterium]
MTRSARLQSARAWLTSYHGKNVAKGYRKHFGVDWACAFKELDMLGVKLASDCVARTLRSVERAAARRRNKAGKTAHRSDETTGPVDQDATFAYIAGYTSGGAPFGITWEEWSAGGEGDSLSRETEYGSADEDDEDSLPF